MRPGIAVAPPACELLSIAVEAGTDLGEAPLVDAHVDAVADVAGAVDEAQVADQHVEFLASILSRSQCAYASCQGGSPVVTPPRRSGHLDAVADAERAVLQQVADAPRRRDVGERVAVEDEQVGAAAGAHRAEVVLDADGARAL